MARSLISILLVIVATGTAEARPWGWLGVRIRDLSEHEMEEISKRHGIREGFGAVIVEVLEGTPAARAGVRNGDLVVAFNDRPVVDTRMLQKLIAAAPIGEELRMTVLRPDTGRRGIAVRLAPMPVDVAGDRTAAEFGFMVREPSGPPEPGAARGGAATPSVSAVAAGGRAERAGLRIGDVIVQVNESPVLSREAARAALAEVPLDRALRLMVRRADGVVSLSLAPVDPP
jgi:S1-C subfamily serine protease